MLRQQVWMVYDEFDHIVKNSQRVLRLNDQYENRPYVEEFTKECNAMFVYGTYVLEGEEDAEFSYGDTAWNYLEKTSDLPLNTKIINQTHKIMMEDERVLVGEYRKSSAFAGYHTFASANRIERWMEDAIFRFHETKKDDPIMAATNLFGNINMHPFEDGNERICRLVLVRFDTDEVLSISSHFELLS